MKKILLVLLLIFLGHNAFAMYCWEETSGSYTHTSLMTPKLGASNITKVNTVIKATGIQEGGWYYTDKNCNKAYFDTTPRYDNFEFAANNIMDFDISGVVPNSCTGSDCATISGYYGFRYSQHTKTLYAWIYDVKSSACRDNEGAGERTISLFNPRYVHTFCTTVGGGGGGAAGAAVNYIIKAD